MVTQISKQTWIRSSIVSVVCLILFFVLNYAVSDTSANEESKKITKAKAIEIGEAFITEKTGASIKESAVVYDSPKDYTGYITKQKTVSAHYEHIDNILPVEKYRVFALLHDIDTEVYVDLNFVTGNVIGWSLPLNEQLTVDEASKALVLETLKSNGFPIEGLQLKENADGSFIATNESALSVTDSIIQVEVSVVQLDGQPFITSYLPKVMVPADYIAETSKQDTLASWYTNLGFLGLSVVLAILALVYAIIYRKFTSFKYGIAFTIIATVLSCIAQISMLRPIQILQSNTMVEDALLTIFMNIFVAIIILFTGVSYYFSFVAGDGLWKAQGFNLWPRYKEKEFGQTVWNSMLLGFLFALSGLGIQALIFQGLSLIIGTYSAVDALQSPLNSSILWFFPALAWVAAISEEAVYRYFGVGIFRRWFKSTYAAAIIPSLIWALGHTLYPLYPVSTRIIELLIIGVLLTWVMVKFGLLAVIFTHAIFNTIAMSMSLFTYGETFDMIMGVLYIVMPIVVAYIIKLVHARYIRNRPEPPAAPPVEHYTPHYRPGQPD